MRSTRLCSDAYRLRSRCSNVVARFLITLLSRHGHPQMLHFRLRGTSGISLRPRPDDNLSAIAGDPRFIKRACRPFASFKSNYVTKREVRAPAATRTRLGRRRINKLPRPPGGARARGRPRAAGSLISQFFNEFKGGRTDLTDDLRLSTATTEDNVTTVRLTIETEKIETYQQIRTSLRIGEESSIYCYYSEIKRQSAQWVFPFAKLPIKVKRARSVGKKMGASFFGMTGFYRVIILEDKRTVTADWCSNDCLPLGLQKIRENRPRSRIFLDLDNASTGTPKATTTYLGTLDSPRQEERRNKRHTPAASVRGRGGRRLLPKLRRPASVRADDTLGFTTAKIIFITPSRM
ncbi:hypothetical protein EVAR_65407_1 [Eumeta japonica]|uniref:Uncharacterized protein n=1 Tax=Eumeta variegata TaxID=151549 RepID=A0A4C1ZNU8_EUMVA|nr:hypothetical protein EVAR_65407_1 [Eumeta japonica]